MALDHFDVVIIGAGLSGVGAAHHLQTNCPDRAYVILEGRQAIGGTWDLFRYPGIRSDSDMYTLGYAFKPWTEAKAIADGPSILKYVRDTAKDEGIEGHIRFGHRVQTAAWSTTDGLWTVESQVDGKPVQVTCQFLFLCGGYYNYDRGYTPDFPGAKDFKGDLVHPQHWPENLDYAGKKVVVIGSGATAVTLVPEMAKTAAHVTMLQRSPTYVVSRPAEDTMANKLRKWLPSML
ncbi:MAG: NAD(P)/FAD-dependent oxidoreductase, partial [Alphaproteobacteria bacterium]